MSKYSYIAEIHNGRDVEWKRTTTMSIRIIMTTTTIMITSITTGTDTTIITGTGAGSR